MTARSLFACVLLCLLAFLFQNDLLKRKNNERFLGVVCVSSQIIIIIIIVTKNKNAYYLL